MTTLNNEHSTEWNKAFIIRHFEEFVNLKNSNIAFANFAEDFFDHDELGGPAVGPQKAKDMMDRAYQLWPDLHVKILHIIAEKDLVMVRNQWTGTDARSGKKIEFHGFVLWRLAGGKIVERWATITSPTEPQFA
jgi:predicted ester cyclase